MTSTVSSRKRRRSASSSQPRPEPEEIVAEDVEEQSARLTRTDLMCPICFDLYNEVYITQCGHSFCFQCISAVVRQSKQCPVCKTAVPTINALHPNCSLNDVVTKFRSQIAANKEASKGSQSVAEILSLASECSQEEIHTLLCGLAKHSKQMARKEEQVKTAVVISFMDRAIQKKVKDLERLQSEIDVLNADHARLAEEQRLLTDDQEPVMVALLESAVVPSGSPPTASQSVVWSDVISKRRLRVEANFEEILEDYLSSSLPPVGEPQGEAERLETFSDRLQKFTQFQTFHELATLTYGDPTSNCCIVSSIEFDRDGEFFAVAGVTKKIKVFEYRSVIMNTGFNNHFPVHEMNCAAKLSCVAYNPYHKHHLVSSDYEGCVCVWDTNVGRRTALYQEHGRRAWSVTYNPLEPTLFASGSDDCTVKLWSMGQPNSIFSFSARANICSVKFNPHSRYLLAYGSADHGVHYVDLRKPNQPLLELLGHKKAVSYVSFMGPEELVSASTDSELKSWHTGEGVCRKTYHGHTNDKNFVGLTVTPDFIACGSETNAVYVYAKQVSSPMLIYQYNSPRGLLPSSAAGEASEPSDFVSAVCWRGESNILVAANSQGHIKVLEMR